MAAEVRRLDPADVPSAVASIDRSEHIDVLYQVVDGELRDRPVDIDSPAWDPVGTGPHSVHHHVELAASLLEQGGVALGAFAPGDEHGDELLGVAIVVPRFEPPMSWFGFLHVSRAHRRRGAASALWERCVAESRAAGATSMYVSAAETGSAVGFYLSRGCRLADPVHPALFELEPEDIHLVLPLT